jgi:putative ABC transport system substrate-binding protein
MNWIGANSMNSVKSQFSFASKYFSRPSGSYRNVVTEGALMSYGPAAADIVRRSASYVDRILKGERPTALPVQAPVKYDLVLNLKTANALGLTVPPTLLAIADEVIE